MIYDNKYKKSKYSTYKPFTIRDYSRKSSEENLFSKIGGLGPNIGGEDWIKEKQKRERIRDFTQRLENMKKENLVFSREL